MSKQTSNKFSPEIRARTELSASARAWRDAAMKLEVQRVFAENFGVYGARKVWRRLRQRVWLPAARSTG